MRKKDGKEGAFQAGDKEAGQKQGLVEVWEGHLPNQRQGYVLKGDSSFRHIYLAISRLEIPG